MGGGGGWIKPVCSLQGNTGLGGQIVNRPVTSSKMADFLFLQSFQCHFVLNDSNNLNYSSRIWIIIC